MNYTNRTKGKAYIIEKTNIQTILGVSKIYDSGGADTVTDRHEISNVAPSGIVKIYLGPPPRLCKLDVVPLHENDDSTRSTLLIFLQGAKNY